MTFGYCRGEQPRLAHAAAEPLAQPARARDERVGADDDRAGGRAERLGEADRRAVGGREHGRERLAERVGRVPHARAVEVEWGGSRPIASITSAQVLTAASPDAQNTLDQPEAVRDSVSEALGVPVVLPLRDGMTDVVAAIKSRLPAKEPG